MIWIGNIYAYGNYSTVTLNIHFAFKLTKYLYKYIFILILVYLNFKISFSSFPFYNLGFYRATHSISCIFIWFLTCSRFSFLYYFTIFLILNNINKTTFIQMFIIFYTTYHYFISSLSLCYSFIYIFINCLIY